MNITAQPILNRDFQYSSHHLKRDYIARKSPAFAQNLVGFATSEVCQLCTVDPACRNMLKRFRSSYLFIYLIPCLRPINIYYIYN